MVLGHDFHSVSGYQQSRQNRGENLRGPTWRHLLTLLRAVPIALEACFFTNVYIGLREGEVTTGRFPGSRDPAFVERCRRFFLRQLEVQRPRLVLALGTFVPPFLAPLSPELARWRRCRGFRKLDENGLAIVPAARA